MLTRIAPVALARSSHAGPRLTDAGMEGDPDGTFYPCKGVPGAPEASPVQTAGSSIIKYANEKAKAGEPWAVRELLDSVLGKAQTNVDVTAGAGDLPINLDDPALRTVHLGLIYERQIELAVHLLEEGMLCFRPGWRGLFIPQPICLGRNRIHLAGYGVTDSGRSWFSSLRNKPLCCC